VQMVGNSERNSEANKPVQKAKEEAINSPAPPARPFTEGNMRPATVSSFGKKFKKFPEKYPWAQKNGAFESLNLDSISKKMVDRLMSLQAIYGKHLSLDGKTIYNPKAKNNTKLVADSKKNQTAARKQTSINRFVKTSIFNEFTKEFWNVLPGVDKDVSLTPRRPGIGIRHRNWHEPVKRQGGWIRIFPFSSGNEVENNKGKSIVNIKAVVAKTTHFLRAAEEVVTKFPHQTDEFYNKYLQRACRFNTEIWLPPI